MKKIFMFGILSIFLLTPCFARDHAAPNNHPPRNMGHGYYDAPPMHNIHDRRPMHSHYHGYYSYNYGGCIHPCGYGYPMPPHSNIGFGFHISI